jgi:hypothetical protein
VITASRAAALVCLVAFGCEADAPSAPTVDVTSRGQRIAPESTSISHEVAPAEPVTVTRLVADGTYWRIKTAHGPVHVWVPKGYKPKRAETVVYVHGFYTHVDQAWDDHHLPEQFASSAINAIFIACEAPASGSEPVAWASIADLLTAVEAGIGQKVPRKRLVAVGHSGAWRTLIGWLDEPILDTVVLFDAAYGELDSYKTWILASDKHRLIDVGDNTRKWTEELHKDLAESVVLEGFPPADQVVPRALRRARIIYIRSNVGHFPLVTGGIALPLTLRMLRGKQLLHMPLADLLDATDE